MDLIKFVQWLAESLEVLDWVVLPLNLDIHQRLTTHEIAQRFIRFLEFCVSFFFANRICIWIYGLNDFSIAPFSLYRSSVMVASNNEACFVTKFAVNLSTRGNHCKIRRLSLLVWVSIRTTEERKKCFI